MAPTPKSFSSQSQSHNQSRAASDIYSIIDSPIGELTVVTRDDSLKAIGFGRSDVSGMVPAKASTVTDIHRAACEQLAEYFAGEREEFRLKLAPEGTLFQRRVWRALRSIPFGQTVSYGYIAQQIGNSKASRAVGAANGKNPIPIVVPCHRVIGTNGKLTGFAGGLATKAQLLALEGWS